MIELILKRKMLVFHSAYTFDDLEKRGLQIFVTSRDAGQFFNEVLTVSPVASLQYPPNDSKIFTKPAFYKLNANNIILEGRVGRFQSLKRFKFLNFVSAQVSLLYTLIKYGGLKEVELVRAEDPRFNGIYGYVFSRLLRKPLVIGVWGNPARIRESTNAPLTPRLFPTVSMEERVEKFILTRASVVLAQNSDNLSFALSLGVEPKRTRILPLGVGIDSAHFLKNDERVDVSSDFRKLGISDERVVVCISRLESTKAVDQAILASKVIKKHYSYFKLLIIGDGREKARLEKLAKDLGIEREVVFAGNRSQVWIAGALAKSDISIAPLTGRALLETALSGCPVVAYDIDWHGEIVKSGRTGELVENLNYQKLAEAAVRILQNNPVRIDMGNNIRALALEMANPEMIVKKQIDIYKSLTEKNNL